MNSQEMNRYVEQYDVIVLYQKKRFHIISVREDEGLLLFSLVKVGTAKKETQWGSQYPTEAYTFVYAKSESALAKRFEKAIKKVAHVDETPVEMSVDDILSTVFGPRSE